MAKVRRKGKPYNPGTATVHDRRSHDLLRNAQVAVDEVDDPYEAGGKIVVLRSTRHDPLMDRKNRKYIDQAQFVAGRHFEMAFEHSEIGSVRAIDPSKEAVDGGRLPEMVTDAQRKGWQDLTAAKGELGPWGYDLVCDVLGRKLSINQAAMKRNMNRELDRKYMGRRFDECLQSLAYRYGYAMRDRT